MDFSNSPPRALKKSDILINSFNIIFLTCPSVNFIIINLPVPGFPLIHRKPQVSRNFLGSSQS